MLNPNHLRSSVMIAAVLALLFPLAASAAQRTFVSAGSGSDSNPCSRALPCRNFAAAITQTDPGGEVVVLDSGGYGAVTISQSVALVAPAGVHAAITAFSGNAITISANASDVVILRGLYLSGLGGSHGIDFNAGQTLLVESCVLSGFASAGLFGRADNSDVYVIDTVSRQNSDGFNFAAITSIRASLDSIRTEKNGNGVEAGSNSLVTVTRSVAAGNGGTGFLSDWTSAVINLESCTTTLNGVGVFAHGIARVADSMITGNTTGVATGPDGTIISFGNNRLSGNTTNGTFSTTIVDNCFQSGGCIAECSDGLDNDGDGLIDFHPTPGMGDPECRNPDDDSEAVL